MHLISSVLLLFASSCLGYEEVSSPEYIAKTAAEKSDIIWANLMEDTNPGDWPGLLELPHLFQESMCPTIRYSKYFTAIFSRKLFSPLGLLVTSYHLRMDGSQMGQGGNSFTLWALSAR